jgi:DNA polymerase-3 subunit gamma/tau
MAMPVLIRPVSSVKRPKKVEVVVTKKEIPEKKPLTRLNDRFNKYHSAHSLSHLLKDEPKKVSEPVAADENRPATPFDQNQMAELWKIYVSKSLDKKNRSLYLTLNSRAPELKDNFVLEFPIENIIQKQQIESISLDLVNYLRERLNNFSIVLKTPIREGEKQKTYYSSEERYKYLAEKYPIIEKLRKNLDLDIDY